MNHQRKIIRNAIVDLLRTGGTAVGERVFDSAYKPRVQFPSLLVLTMGEDQRLMSDIGDIADRGIERVMHLDVIAEVQQNVGAEDTRDDLLAEVEALLAQAASAYAIPGVKNIVPVAMRSEDDQRGEKPIDVGRQRFAITFHTTQGDPSTAV